MNEKDEPKTELKSDDLMDLGSVTEKTQGGLGFNIYDGGDGYYL